MPDLRKIPEAILKQMIEAARLAKEPQAKEGLAQLAAEARRRGMRLPDGVAPFANVAIANPPLANPPLISAAKSKSAEPAGLEPAPPMTGLDGERVRLAPLAKPFANAMFRWLNRRDPESLAGDYGPMAESMFEEWFKEKSLPPFTMFVIALKGSNAPIGWCSLNFDPGFARSAELSVVLCEPQAHGRGYGREALRLLLDHAFHDRDLARVQLTTRVDNTKALACFEALGFQREGLLREARYAAGRRHDVVIMGLLQREHPGPAASA